MMPPTWTLALLASLCAPGAWALHALEVPTTGFLEKTEPILDRPRDGLPSTNPSEGSNDTRPRQTREAGQAEAPDHGPLEHGSPAHGAPPEIEEVDHEKTAGGGHENAHTGSIVIYELGGLMILASLTFGMANSSNEKLRNYTWHTVDNVVSIFLAVLVFQAVDEVLVDSGVLPKEHRPLCMVLYAVLMLVVAVFLALALKSQPSNLAVFAAASGHFVAFAFMHAASVQMEHHSGSVFRAALVFILFTIGVGVMYVGMFYFKQYLGVTADPELLEKVDDLENDAGAMGVAIGWTLLVCFIISGQFQDVEKQAEVQARERTAMLVYAVVITIAAGAFLIWTSKDETVFNPRGSYFANRARSFFASFQAMCVAWAFLLWGKWSFHDAGPAEDRPIWGRLLFALAASLVAMVVIALMAQLKLSHQYGRQEHWLVLTAVGLIVGWAWEELFDESIEAISEDYEEGHRAIFKCAAMASMMVVILPVHLFYFKPLVLKMRDI